MEFSLPTNWDDALSSVLKSIDTKSLIKEVYGKLALDDIGGGRGATTLSSVSRQKAKQHIRKLHSLGYRFNYLLNSLCMDNLEFTRLGQKNIRRLLDWLIRVEVDAVTVANPYLMMFIKRNYPHLSVSVSAWTDVDSLNRARFWEDLGADKITFPGPIFNRNFNFLKQLRKSVKCKIQLIANNACLSNCPTAINHGLASCHASQSWHKCKGYALDYHIIMCQAQRLRDPVNFIRSDWIRPEDIHFYEELGVDMLKLVDRRMPTVTISKISKAYLDGTYMGNLMDLLPAFHGKTFNAHKGWVYKFFYMGDLFSMNVLKMIKYSKVLSKLEVYIDNQKLDSFINNFPPGCDIASCNTCGYCQRVTEEAVRINEDYRKKLIGQYDTLINNLFHDGLS